MKQDSIINPNAAAVKSAEARLKKHDWDRTGSDLNSFGCAVMDKLLTRDECREIAALYPKEELFRSHIHMDRHGFGKGEYRYFKYPLPDLLGGLRTALYPHLAVVANSWNEHMNVERRYPERHAEFLRQCHAAGQARPTPLLLQYVPGDFNCLHQDLYGDLAFPLQVAILLSEPDRDFTGGEFVITEQRPRMQSRAEVVPLRQGDAVAFAVHNPPGARHQGQLSGQPSSRRQPSAFRPTAYRGYYFPRCQIAKPQNRRFAELPIFRLPAHRPSVRI